jgi:hypothetical protein
MKKTRKTILTILPLTLLMGICMAQNAQAGVRVKATVSTPTVRVQFGNVPFGHDRSFTRGVLPVRILKYHRISMRDKLIARRLASYTGAPEQLLINLKARGYTWSDIGRWLYVPRPVVRAAMNQKTWKRFVHRGRPFMRRGFDGPRRDRVSHVDPKYYENFGEYGGDIGDRPIGKYKEKFGDD